MLKFLLTIFILQLLVISKLDAEIYKWVDDKGQVHYTNEKPENKQVEKVILSKSLKEYSSDNISKIKPLEKVTKFKPLFGPTEPYSSKKGGNSNSLVMYSASWCGYCKKARAYFYEKNIRFTEYDIETNDSARSTYENLGGRGVPFLVAGDKKMHGFNISQFNKFYKK